MADLVGRQTYKFGGSLGSSLFLAAVWFTLSTFFFLNKIHIFLLINENEQKYS